MESTKVLLFVGVILLLRTSSRGQVNWELKDCQNQARIDTCNRPRDQIGVDLTTCRSDTIFGHALCRCPGRDYCLKVVENTATEFYNLTFQWVTKPEAACDRGDKRQIIGQLQIYCDFQRGLYCAHKIIEQQQYKYNTCECEKGYIFYEERDACVVNTRSYSNNEPCITSSDCAPGYWLRCLDAKCKCPYNFHFSYFPNLSGARILQCYLVRSTCTNHCRIPNILTPWLKDCWYDTDCKPERDEICFHTGCVCPSRREFSETMRGCKLLAGESCFDKDNDDNQYLHDVCMSGNCGPTKVCSCPDSPTTGHRMVWSSSVEQCVAELHDHPCQSNYDCSTTRQVETLICLPSGRCGCEGGRVHIRSFCREAIRNHGEECDIQGHGPTCSIEKGLHCVGVGDNQFNRCRCVPKERYGHRTFIPYVLINNMCQPAVPDGGECDSADVCIYDHVCVLRTCRPAPREIAVAWNANFLFSENPSLDFLFKNGYEKKRI